MKIIEITNQDKSFLYLSGIKYDFDESHDIIMFSYKFIGNNISNRNNLKNYIESIHTEMNKFLSYGFSKNDPDIIRVSEQYKNLEDIKNQL